MQALEDLRRAIDTVEDLQSIARTMKALAAASIRQYERALDSLQAYRRSVDLGLSVVLRDVAPEVPTPPRPAQQQHIAAIVFGSDRGLCGRFNEEIADFAVAQMNGLQVPQAQRLLLAIGARVGARLERLHQPLQECFFVPGSVAAITSTVQDIVLKLEQWQRQRQIEQAWLYYHHHARSARQTTALRLLPFDFARFTQRSERWPSRRRPTYSMDRRALLAALVRQHVFVSLFHACAESLAAEHASRLLSMQTAEKNIEEHLQTLAMRFRQHRQESITEELLDVVAGFEALTPGTEQQIG
jgi:F-type H+-transporting ATPase subunit gamma